MKTLIAFFFFSFLVQIGFSQVIVNETDINTIENVTYIEVTFLLKKAKTFIAFINYGQAKGDSELTQVNNPDKKFKEFNNEIDILNFMAKNGWELKQIITVPSLAFQNQMELKYIMNRKQR